LIQSNINVIKTHLSGYLEKVARGETVIILRSIKQISYKREYPGFELSDTCLAPLPDDVIADFYGDKKFDVPLLQAPWGALFVPATEAMAAIAL
jgi:hypothetical protein